MDKIQNSNREIRVSGVEILRRENRLERYIETLDDNERRQITSLDLGVNDVVGEIQLREFKERQSRYSKSYSMTNG